MSLPMASVASVGQGLLHPLDAFLASVNTNPYLIGTAMLLLNLGGRFIAMEVTKAQETFFQNVWVRRFLIFVVLFMGTRNVLVAFWLSLFIILCLGYLFNENSTLCLFTGGTCKSSTGVFSSSESTSSAPAPSPSAPPFPGPSGGPLIQGFTAEETAVYNTLSNKLKRISEESSKEEEKDKEKEKGSDKSPDMMATYLENMMVMRSAEGFRNMLPRF